MHCTRPLRVAISMVSRHRVSIAKRMAHTPERVKPPRVKTAKPLSSDILELSDSGVDGGSFSRWSRFQDRLASTLRRHVLITSGGVFRPSDSRRRVVHVGDRAAAHRYHVTQARAHASYVRVQMLVHLGECDSAWLKHGHMGQATCTHMLQVSRARPLNPLCPGSRARPLESLLPSNHPQGDHAV